MFVSTTSNCMDPIQRIIHTKLNSINAQMAHSTKCHVTINHILPQKAVELVITYSACCCNCLPHSYICCYCVSIYLGYIFCLPVAHYLYNAFPEDYSQPPANPAKMAVTSPSSGLDIEQVRKQFPALQGNTICLNNAGGSLVHKGAIES